METWVLEDKPCKECNKECNFDSYEECISEQTSYEVQQCVKNFLISKGFDPDTVESTLKTRNHLISQYIDEVIQRVVYP